MIRKVLACYFFLKISVPIRAQISAIFFASLHEQNQGWLNSCFSPLLSCRQYTPGYLFDFIHFVVYISLQRAKEIIHAQNRSRASCSFHFGQPFGLRHIFWRAQLWAWPACLRAGQGFLAVCMNTASRFITCAGHR